MDNVEVAILGMLGLVTFGIGYLGFQLTISPPESRKAKIWYRIVFVALTLTIVGLNSWQTYRNSTTQKAQLDQIEENTKQQPNVHVTVPPPQIIPNKERAWVVLSPRFIKGRLPPFTFENPFIANIYQENIGNVPAREIELWDRVSPKDRLLSVTEEHELFLQFRSSIKNKRERGPPTYRSLGAKQTQFYTIDPKPWTQEMAAAVTNKKLFLYMLVLVKYEDETGNHDTEFCAIFWGTEPVFHYCQTHNGPL